MPMRGVTLVELLIVLALMTSLASLSIGPGIQEFERTLARTDGARTAAIARHVRARAMHGVPETLYWSEPTKSLVLSSDETYPLTGNEHATNLGIIGFPGPGGDTATGTIRLQNEGSSTWSITVGSGGAIDLEHDI